MSLHVTSMLTILNYKDSRLLCILYRFKKRAVSVRFLLWNELKSFHCLQFVFLAHFSFYSVPIRERLLWSRPFNGDFVSYFSRKLEHFSFFFLLALIKTSNPFPYELRIDQGENHACEFYRNFCSQVLCQCS